MLPPTSAPIKRGLVLGMAISAAAAVPPLAIMWWFVFRTDPFSLVSATVAYTVALGLGLPWNVLFVRLLKPGGYGDFLIFFASIVLNGAIVGIVSGVITRRRQSRDA